MDIQWESELTELLSRLSGTQERLLDLLSRKRNLLVQRDYRALADLAPAEQSLGAELEACHARRQELLAQASSAGLPADSIRSLSRALPAREARELREPLEDASRRSRLLRQQCFAQWVATQRTMLHLSHLIEIIATGGQPQPTYGKGGVSAAGGTLMDQAV
jgi:hypothetical protein